MKRNLTLSRVWTVIFAVAMMFVANSAWADVTLTALSGTGGTGNEGYASLIDGKANTKWGQSFDPNATTTNDYAGKTAYIIFKTSEAIVPTNYFLVTGSDTGSYKTRNWSDWNIKAANFASDEEATADADGWVLIDDRSAEVLPATNMGAADFNFNVPTSTAYTYYKIEVTQAVATGDIWLQMGEFGFGTSDDFMAKAPITYTIVAGDRNNTDGEGLSKLFDGLSTTKWGNSLTAKSFGSTTNGAYFIVKTSRPIAPTYYKLVTGTDNASWNHRNWKDWQIYAIADAETPTRTSEGWVMIDRKENISEDVLPDKNSYPVYFTMSEGNTTKYQYFKVEIDDIMSGDGYMQMSEFALGDASTLQTEIEELYADAEDNIDMDGFSEKALRDQYAAGLETLKNSADAVAMNTTNNALTALATSISESENQYAQLTSIMNQAKGYVDDSNLDASGLTYMEKYLSDTEIAPCDDYPLGNYAYLKANCQATGAEVVTEADRMSAYVQNHIKNVGDPITTEYTFIDGTSDNWNSSEGPASLIDGDRESTKWGTGTSETTRWIVFKANDGKIKPTYFGLVTGGDTYSYPDRNWKNWKIYGANFSSDEEATKDADSWVMIDQHSNVGTDILATTNCFESYINLSEGCSEAYEYFKIEVVHSGGMQMNEFTFYNVANFREKREEFVADYEGYDVNDYKPCYAEYSDGFTASYKTMCEATSASTLMSMKNKLDDYLTAMETSHTYYEAYDSIYGTFDSSLFDYEGNVKTWAADYESDEEMAPSTTLINGNHAYIMSKCQLDNTGINNEGTYLSAMIAAATDPESAGYIVLGGHTNSEWGDGFYGNIVDNSKDEDGKLNTKWGGEASSAGDTYCIFRTIEPVNPFFYTLTTGGDTYSYQGRNWKYWEIYGANFEGDAQATKDAEGWVLVDKKENVGQNRLHPENLTASYFGFSTETTVPYTYYKVVVYQAYSGSSIQMQELRFGTSEEFDAIKEDYTASAKEFDYEQVAYQAYIDRYAEDIEAIGEATNMEQLFRIKDDLDNLQDSITESAANYAHYEAQVAEVKEYLANTTLGASAALDALTAYLTTNAEPSETYPNGTAAYILEDHTLIDSCVVAESDFLTELQAAAVAAGYGKGADISSMIINRQLAKSTSTGDDVEGGRITLEGWEGRAYSNGTSADKSMSAAEFCNEATTYDLHQTLTGLKNGYYQVKLNAGFRPNGDITSYNYAAKAYANDIATYIPAVIEEKADSTESWHGSIADKEVYEVNEAGDTTATNYVIWGVLGSCHAFNNGRYEITMVAKVTDGNLTIGVKNDGTPNGGDWTAASNFRLTYLGEEEADATEAITAAATYNAARTATMTETYVPNEASADNFILAPNFAAADKAALAALNGQNTYAALEAYTALVNNIADTKTAYSKLYDLKNKVYDRWINAVTEEHQDALDEAVYGVVGDIDEGTYADAAAATAAYDALYAQYPDYYSMSDSSKLSVSFNEEYAYELTTSGKRPFTYLKDGRYYQNNDATILKFEYKSDTDLENGIFFWCTPDLTTNQNDTIPTLEATSEYKTVYFNVKDAVEKYGFGSLESSFRWDLSTTIAADAVATVGARHFQLITEAQMKAEGGKCINGTDGDANGDGEVTSADIQAVLNVIAGETESTSGADANGDGEVTSADIQAILNIIAGN